MAETVDGQVEDLALTWSGRALDVGRIEAELGKLRYLAAGENATAQGFALRTSLLNMVVYTEREEERDFASRVVEDLASHHPSRALIVLARPNPDGQSHIQAQIAAHCHISRSLDQSVCCEEIGLTVAGPAALHLHSVIVPLLVPDLPVYVWWAEPWPARTNVISRLADGADRVIVDSQAFDDQAADLLHLARLSERVRRTTIGDLNWDRTEPWRDFLSGQRNIAEMHHHFASMNSVEIGYASGEGQQKPAQAFLLLAWLAGELGWDTHSVSAHGPQRLTFRAEEGHQIAAYVRPVDQAGAEPGSIVGVKITGQSETAGCSLSINRTGEADHLIVLTEHVAGGAGEEHVRFEHAELSQLLMMELDADPHDPQYGKVLQTAVPLISAVRA